MSESIGLFSKSATFSAGCLSAHPLVISSVTSKPLSSVFLLLRVFPCRSGKYIRFPVSLGFSTVVALHFLRVHGFFMQPSKESLCFQISLPNKSIHAGGGFETINTGRDIP